MFADWQKCGFSLNISTDLSHYLCLRVSHWVLPHWSVTNQFTYMRLWSTEFVSPQAQWVGMLFTFHPYLMQTASMNSCLFSAYPIALISKADSQEDAPFSIALFMSCCDSGVSSPKSSSLMFLHFSLAVFCFSCVWQIAGLRGYSQDRVFECRFWLLVYQWSE